MCQSVAAGTVMASADGGDVRIEARVGFVDVHRRWERCWCQWFRFGSGRDLCHIDVEAIHESSAIFEI